MGEYYKWVNIDKKEYITPRDFGYGNKFWESMHKDSDSLHALRALLADEWRGDGVLWLGDIIGVSDSRPEGYLLLKKLYMDR